MRDDPPPSAAIPNSSLLGEIEGLERTPVSLTAAMNARMAERFGAPLTGLRVFEDAGLREMGQRGYARGNEIHLAEGELGRGGDEVLMHEAGHVVQQGMGAARGSGILHSTGLEMQADAGFAAPAGFTMPAGGAGPIQGFEWPWRKRRDAEERAKAESLGQQITQTNRNTFEPANRVSFAGLNGKRMRKNMQYMQMAQRDMGVGVNAIIGTAPGGHGSDSIASDAVANAHAVTRNIRYNTAVGDKPVEPIQRINDRGGYDYRATNDNYAGAHEYGHIVTFDIAKRMYGEGDEGGYANDVNNRWTAQEIVRESGMNAARNSKSFRKALAGKAGIQLGRRNMDELSPEEISSMQSALTPRNLHKMGYLSGYGATNHDETIAESFADEYRTRNKKEKEKGRWFNFGRKKTPSNPFAREVVNVSKQLTTSLSQNEQNGSQAGSYVADFKERHAGFRNQNQEAYLATEQTKQSVKAHWKREETNQDLRANTISLRIVSSGGADIPAFMTTTDAAHTKAKAMNPNDEVMELTMRVGLMKQVLDDWERRYPAQAAAAPAAAP
ncbi:MAG: DUF4157 domain-containing protein [Oscillospiraceae bacterium]|nr:DUF4157 domain-containing protein [Oscillospiraceae bacterium]